MSGCKTVSNEEILKQLDYCQRVKNILVERYPDGYKAFVHIYGCQQNVSDGERLKGLLSQMGYSFTDNVNEADLVLYDTCAVREHAEDRVIGNIGALKAHKRERPDCIIAVCGCMTQQPHVAEKLKKSYPFVNIVFGTHTQYKFAEYIYNNLIKRKRVYDIPDENLGIAEGIPVHRDSNIKGWLPVMYGCNNFCTYCVVPYVRGRERSRTPDEIIKEAKQMIACGIKDITLLGQNVNSYGKGCDFEMDFADLLREINSIEGDFVIRFMTSHPKDCTEKLLLAMSECEKVAKHLHLPFQSGSSRVLKQMNRYYDRQQYLKLVKKAKELIPDISLTSDVIVGFPGETREDFEQTVSLIKEVEFTSLFTFIYSPRKGTPAAVMPDPVTAEEKSKWFTELCKVQEEIAATRTKSYEGKVFKVLCEEYKDGVISGRTGTNVMIDFLADKKYLGSFVDVQVTKAKTWVLTGKLLDK